MDEIDQLTGGSPLPPSIDHFMELEGVVDISTARELHEEVDRLVGQGADSLTIDMSRVSFMDSSGITFLLNARQRTSVAIRAPSVAVRQLIEVTGLTEFFQILD